VSKREQDHPGALNLDLAAQKWSIHGALTSHSQFYGLLSTEPECRFRSFRSNLLKNRNAALLLVCFQSRSIWNLE
jgi:hypothetical protein